MTDQGLRSTPPERVVELPEVTIHDSNNVERTWRRWKAHHLISTPGKLAKMLGRRVG